MSADIDKTIKDLRATQVEDRERSAILQASLDDAIEDLQAHECETSVEPPIEPPTEPTPGPKLEFSAYDDEWCEAPVQWPLALAIKALVHDYVGESRFIGQIEGQAKAWLEVPLDRFPTDIRMTTTIFDASDGMMAIYLDAEQDPVSSTASFENGTDETYSVVVWARVDSNFPQEPDGIWSYHDGQLSLNKSLLWPDVALTGITCRLKVYKGRVDHVLRAELFAEGYVADPPEPVVPEPPVAAPPTDAPPAPNPETTETLDGNYQQGPAITAPIGSTVAGKYIKRYSGPIWQPEGGPYFGAAITYKEQNGVSHGIIHDCLIEDIHGVAIHGRRGMKMSNSIVRNVESVGFKIGDGGTIDMERCLFENCSLKHPDLTSHDSGPTKLTGAEPGYEDREESYANIAWSMFINQPYSHGGFWADWANKVKEIRGCVFNGCNTAVLTIEASRGLPGLITNCLLDHGGRSPAPQTIWRGTGILIQNGKDLDFLNNAIGVRPANNPGLVYAYTFADHNGRGGSAHFGEFETTGNTCANNFIALFGNPSQTALACADFHEGRQDHAATNLIEGDTVWCEGPIADRLSVWGVRVQNLNVREHVPAAELEAELARRNPLAHWGV